MRPWWGLNPMEQRSSFVPYLELPSDLKTRIIAAQTRADTTIRDVCEQDVALSLLYAAAVETLIEANVPASRLKPSAITDRPYCTL